MELTRIENLTEKYFQGETSIVEEKELQLYFSSPDVAQHLEQYKPVFGYFSKQKEQQFIKTIPLKSKLQNKAKWLSIAATVVVMLGVGTFMYWNSEKPVSGNYGSYDDPEIALKETQKALALVSEKLNVGIESVSYITEYEQSKNRIFKK
jgi:hypothetical protein